MHKALALFFLVVLPLTACSPAERPATASTFGLPQTVPPATGDTASSSAQGGRPGSTGVIYVISQGLYFDTFVAVDPLPMQGPFQLLANGQTQFGPGDPGYLGGRWWEDLNGNGNQDASDHFFLCPLLPPGRPTP